MTKSLEEDRIKMSKYKRLALHYSNKDNNSEKLTSIINRFEEQEDIAKDKEQSLRGC